MRISTKSFIENMKSISVVISDFIYIDCTDEKNYAFYVSTDTQAMKIPLDISDVKEDEKKIYVINKSEFMHLIQYANGEIILNSDYSYFANDNAVKGKFESNDGYAEELESRKILFDHENEYEDFMEVTPSIMEGINNGAIFVSPDSAKPSERFLDIQSKKVFSYSKFRIYINDIDVEHDGLLSNEVIKSIQSLGIGAIVKNNNDSFLITNAQRSIFEYFSTPTDIDFHPVLSEGFQSKINATLGFNKITMNIEELKGKLDYISFYASKNPNSMCFLNMNSDNKISLSTDENTFVDISVENIEKTESFENLSVPFDCSVLQLITSKVGKESETINMYVSSSSENKLVLISFGDSKEMVIIAKLNV